MDQQSIHIFVDEINQRLIYALNLLLADKGVNYNLTNDPTHFERIDEPKFVYSDKPFKTNYLTISPADLLFESDVHPVHVEKVLWEGVEIISFKNKPDIIASAFYVASLYHEYLSDDKDNHNRIIGKDSFLDKNGWLKQCVVDRWSEQLIAYLNAQLSTAFTITKSPLKIIPTFDIDNTYAYKLKVGFRKHMSILKDWSKFDKTRLVERNEVLAGTKRDPYDTFDYIKNIAERGFEVKLFWLLGDFSTFDRNINWKNPHQQRLIQKMNKVVSVGLHPSYKSNEALGVLGEEKKRLEKITGNPVEIARQHFLKIEHPKTFSTLENNGFKHDYSLGFADVVGFRAGLSRPFPWFNLKTNQISDLTLHPLAYMEGTLKDYMNLSVDEAKEVVQELVGEVKLHGGNFICLWHNETIGDYGSWKGWTDVLEFTLQFKSKES
jgi:hypothetical protein